MRLKLRILFILLGLVVAAAVTSRGADPQIDTSLVDTLYIDSVGAAGVNGLVVVPVYFSIQEPLGGFNISLSISSGDLTIDSISFAGGAIDTLLPRGFDTQGGSINIYCAPYPSWIPEGWGRIGDLYLSYSPTITDQLVVVDTATLFLQSTFTTQFIDTLSHPHVPQFRRGYVDVSAGGCCIGTRGNIDGSTSEEIDILDLTYLVAYMFKHGPEPPCLDEANVDGSGNGSIDILDLTYLVTYMFKSGSAPAACP